MSLEAYWNTGGSKTEPHPNKEKSLRDILHVLTGLSLAELKALKPAQRFSGLTAEITGGLRYTWNSTSVLTADNLLVVAATDAPAAGRWLLAAGQEARLSMPITFATADAAALLTVPAGCVLLPRDFWWTITTNFTGGASSAIGVSATVGPTTKGDLLGGAAGDVAAALTTTLSPTFGTIGALWDSVPERRLLLKAATVLRFDRITSAFTAGVGTVEMVARVVANAGA